MQRQLRCSSQFVARRFYKLNKVHGHATIRVNRQQCSAQPTNQPAQQDFSSRCPPAQYKQCCQGQPPNGVAAYKQPLQSRLPWGRGQALAPFKQRNKADSLLAEYTSSKAKQS